MKLTEFARVIDRQLKILYPDVDGEFYCSFQGGDVKEGCMLAGTCGRGSTPGEALTNYGLRIAGNRLVFNAYGSEPGRQEFMAPDRFDPEVNE